jgi:hypothetical protein
MWIVAAAVVLIVLVVLIRLAARHPKGDDLTSVRSYHSALGTLEQLSDRSNRSSIKVVSPRDEAGDAYVRHRSPADSESAPAGPAGRSVPPIPVRGNDEFPDPETPLIFDDARPKDRAPRGTSGLDGPGFRTPRAQRQALDSMNHRPRRVMSTLLVVVALVIFGVLAYAGSHRHGPGKHAQATGGATSTTTAHGTTTTGGSNATSTTVKSATTTTKPAKKSKPVPTTLPTQLVATASTNSSATYPVYPVGSASYQVTVTATGTIWVAATTTATGSTLWAGELQAGAVQNIQASGAVQVQLGTPAATLSVNQIPVVFPTPMRSPFVATFQPGATATTTTTTPTSSTTAP